LARCCGCGDEEEDAGPVVPRRTFAVES
jgi:hypothetical protein